LICSSRVVSLREAPRRCWSLRLDRPQKVRKKRLTEVRRLPIRWAIDFFVLYYTGKQRSCTCAMHEVQVGVTAKNRFFFLLYYTGRLQKEMTTSYSERHVAKESGRLLS